MILDAQNLSYILGFFGLLGIIFAVYNSFKNPQIDADKTILRLREDVDTLKDSVIEIKEKHLNAVEIDIRKLTDTIQQLSITVVRLGTIIDERIPKSINK